MFTSEILWIIIDVLHKRKEVIMSHFSEDVLKEYPPLLKRKSWTKDVSYRIRIVKRRLEGIPRQLLDIREYIVSEKRALFTETGIYLTLPEIDKLIPILIDAKKMIIQEDLSNTSNERVRNVNNNQWNRSRIKDTFSTSEKE